MASETNASAIHLFTIGTSGCIEFTCQVSIESIVMDRLLAGKGFQENWGHLMLALFSER